MKLLYMTILFSFIMLGCQSNHAVTAVKNSTTNEALPGSGDKIIVDVFNHYRIYQRPDKSYYIYKEGRIIYDNLKFVRRLDLIGKNNMQALDKDNKLLEFYLKGVEYPELLPCGVGSKSYRVDILSKRGGFELISKLVSADVGNYPEHKKELNKIKHITKIQKNGIDRIYFDNNKLSIDVGNYNNEPSYQIYYQRGDKYGFYGQLEVKSSGKSMQYKLMKDMHGSYDRITFTVGGILLERDGLVGYYKSTPVKYSKLAPYKGHLARFTLPDGRSGYVTYKGIEYYD